MRIFESARIDYYRPEGAYYILANAPDGFNDGEEFAGFLLKNLGVAVLPAVALYHDKEAGRKKVRLAFCKKDSTLQLVGRRLKKLTDVPKHTLKTTQSR
jgi:aspartate/methionine/tyrosine aminotransferase